MLFNILIFGFSGSLTVSNDFNQTGGNFSVSGDLDLGRASGTFSLMQPINGLVFALDGILIGASDTRFLKWSMVFAALCVFAPIALMALAFDWGIVGVWAGLDALIAARLVFLGTRFAGRRWAVVGYD